MSYRYGTRPSFGSIESLRNEADIQWSIKDFLKIVPHTIDSPAFTFLDHSWYLRLVWNNDGKGFIAVSLHPKQGVVPIDDLVVFVTLGLRKADGSVDLKRNSNRTFEKEKHWNECSVFWKMCEVKENPDELLPGGALVVVCSMIRKVENHPDYLKVVELEMLSNRMKSLYFSKTHFDVTIRVQGTEFQAHKPILVAGSPVFAAAFEHKMTERETGVMIIDDCDPATFSTFLRYLYTGKIEEGLSSFEEAQSLYIAADKYGVKELKSFCIAYMTRNLTVENVCDAAQFCALYESEKEFTATTQHFFNRNACIIFSTPQWEGLLKSDCILANKLLKEMATKVRIVC